MTITAKVMDLLETAIEARVFKTLVKLLETTKLAEALSKSGPYTVFAPTDMAFSKIPKRDIEMLMKDGEKLQSILLHHVLQGEFSVEQLFKSKDLKTMGGTALKTAKANGKQLIGNSVLVETDIKASNGIIHIVDSVILP